MKERTAYYYYYVLNKQYNNNTSRGPGEEVARATIARVREFLVNMVLRHRREKKMPLLALSYTVELVVCVCACGAGKYLSERVFIR